MERLSWIVPVNHLSQGLQVKRGKEGNRGDVLLGAQSIVIQCEKDSTRPLLALKMNPSLEPPREHSSINV